MQNRWMNLFSLLLLLPLCTPAQSMGVLSGQVTQDTTDVQHVMAAFHQAVNTHDSARLSALFIPQGSIWLNVLSDAAFARARITKPDVQKIRVGSYEDFAKVLSKTKSVFDPQHSHVEIRGDGTVASVGFDYVFMIDGKPENKGFETWQLVKGENGWRIAAITYSSNPVGM